MSHHELALAAIDRALDALNDAGSELTVAMALAPHDSALADYEYVRAIDRLQAELDAARAALRRDS